MEKDVMGVVVPRRRCCERGESAVCGVTTHDITGLCMDTVYQEPDHLHT